MKKLFAVILAMIMVFAMTSVALADADDEIIHAGPLPASSEQNVKISISGLQYEGTNKKGLPSEYHIRVKWDISNGVYDATNSDSDTFKNFTWDCTKLDYKLGRVADGATDPRSANWTTEPKVAFEVTNASTPNLKIYATPSLRTEDKWASFMKATLIGAQNTSIGTQEIEPVKVENLGTGDNSYEKGTAPNHNVYSYTYTLNWDYDALNTYALKLYKGSVTDSEFTNTFAVTITADK